MIAESVAFCRERGKRVVYDAEHFFDSYREDPGYALSCLEAAIDAGAENVTLCDTNGASLPDQVAAATEVTVGPLRRARRSRHPRPRRRRLRGRQQPRRGERRGAHGAGDRERLRRALRQRQPDHDPARAAAEDGLRGGAGGEAGDADRDRPLHRRALQPDAEPERALRRPQRLRPQGRHARRRGRGRRPHLRARRAGGGRQRAGDPALGALRQGDDPRPGRAPPGSRSTTRAPRGRSRS